MKVSVLWTFALLVEMCTTLAVSPSSSPLPADKLAFVFRSAGYWHRWSNNDQHEFTPRGQDDLQKWSDMVTINLYPDARDGDALAEAEELADADGLVEIDGDALLCRSP